MNNTIEYSSWLWLHLVYISLYSSSLLPPPPTKQKIKNKVIKIPHHKTKRMLVVRFTVHQYLDLMLNVQWYVSMELTSCFSCLSIAPLSLSRSRLVLRKPLCCCLICSTNNNIASCSEQRYHYQTILYESTILVTTCIHHFLQGV